MSLVDDPFLLADARGGRKPAEPLSVEVVRSLGPADIPALRVRGEVQKSTLPAQSLASLRYGHHSLAKALAEGKAQVEASLLTGYSQAYISSLKNDPAFKELLAYYASQREAIFVDTLERMKTLGIMALEELQERLSNEPAKFSNREAMEMAELMLLKPLTAKGASAGQGPSPGGGVSVTVNFVQTEGAKPVLDLGAGPVIEGTKRE